MSIILTCNAGSTNVKLAAYDAGTLERKDHVVTYNSASTTEYIRSFAELGIVAVGHRVVHGGREFTEAVGITGNVLAKLNSYIQLAPLHQPAALKLIDEARRVYPEIPHIACFDTAFHHSMPEIERRLPLPRNFHDEGIIRYGFHGLSYQYIASVLPEVAGQKSEGRVVVAHLGGGSSACAMKNLKSVATTMGFSTLDGLMMGTRCGVLDAGVLLHLLSEKKMPVDEVSDLLYNRSGLKGVSGESADMKELLDSVDNIAATEAIELYCRLAAKQIAGLLTALGGLDMLVFTGGIGENAIAVRERIVGLLRWAGDFQVYVIPTDEELVIAEFCCNFIKKLH